MKQLSIIVPVYNVEKYIRSCLESIYRQGLTEDCYEVIIVNDGTMDNSMEVIKDIVSQHTNIKIINQKNQGLSVARNNGIKKASGDYILFVDSDDLIVENCLSSLLMEVIKSNADLFVTDFIRMEDEEINKYLNNPCLHYNYDIQEKTGKTLFMEDLNPRECYVWRTIYSRKFLVNNNIKYVPSICFEDIPFTHECYLKAGKCLKTHYPMYIYRIGNASITKKINKKTGKDFGTAIAKTWELRQLDGLSSEIKEKLCDNVFAALSVLLYAIIYDIQDFSDKKDVIRYLKDTAPDLHFKHGIKQNIVNFLFQNLPYAYISIRSLFVKLSKYFLRH